MPGATKKRPIKIEFSADTPQVVLDDLRERYSYWVDPEPGDDEMVDWFQTEEWKKFEASQTPGSWLAGLREATAMSQKALGQKLGGVSPARISAWERGRRAISKEYAKALSKIFGLSVENFL